MLDLQNYDQNLENYDNFEEYVRITSEKMEAKYNKVWVGLDELKKEIKQMYCNQPCECDKCVALRKLSSDLYNSSEIIVTGVGEDNKKVDGSHPDERTTSSSPVQNPKKCTCKYFANNGSKFCGRCGGEL